MLSYRVFHSRFFTFSDTIGDNVCALNNPGWSVGNSSIHNEKITLQ